MENKSYILLWSGYLYNIKIGIKQILIGFTICIKMQYLL